MRLNLQNAAYRCVETVFEHGEYTVRGSIMDIFPMGSDLPYRVDLFDNEIDALRAFDPETQRSISQVEKIALLPAKEFPLTDDAIHHFQNEWYRRFQNDAKKCPIYRDISEGIAPPGVEYYLSLFFQETSTLFSYLPKDTRVFCEDVEEQIDKYWSEAETRYESLRYDIQRPILPPQDILIKKSINPILIWLKTK